MVEHTLIPALRHKRTYISLCKSQARQNYKVGLCLKIIILLSTLIFKLPFSFFLFFSFNDLGESTPTKLPSHNGPGLALAKEKETRFISCVHKTLSWWSCFHWLKQEGHAALLHECQALWAHKQNLFLLCPRKKNSI